MPIVALTAFALASDRVQCVAADMDGYVSKPITVAALVAEIERVIALTGGPVTDSYAVSSATAATSQSA